MAAFDVKSSGNVHASIDGRRCDLMVLFVVVPVKTEGQVIANPRTFCPISFNFGVIVESNILAGMVADKVKDLKNVAFANRNQSAKLYAAKCREFWCDGKVYILPQNVGGSVKPHGENFVVLFVAGVQN